MRAAAPRFAMLDLDDFVEHARGRRDPGIYRANSPPPGFPTIDADELIQARAVGVTGDYIRAMRAAGVRGDLDDFVQLRAVGVTRLRRRAGRRRLRVANADELDRAAASGCTDSGAPAPPRPPQPPDQLPTTGQNPGG